MKNRFHNAELAVVPAISLAAVRSELLTTLPLDLPGLTAVLLILCGVIFLIIALVKEQRTTQHLRFDIYRLEEINPPVPWLRIFGPLIAPISAEIALATGGAVDPIFASSLRFLVTAFALFLMFSATMSPDMRTGPRRAREIAGTSLEGVTASRIESLRPHAAFAAYLIQINAIYGSRVRVDSLAAQLERPASEILETAKQLREVGLANVSTLMSPDTPEKWWIELTEVGVRTFYHLKR
ncbi:hypothetical protein WG936_06185 [Corynebacterium sp. H127]|uniref:hypothetical protein n=1 Tax=Corynebacterium sp. H127 TaxID=3133418 RepID=UPI0030A23C03